MQAARADAGWVSGSRSGVSFVGEGAVPRKRRLLDAVREAIRLRHSRHRTEDAYVGWIRRYVLFHGKRHPTAMGVDEVTAFLSSLAVDGRVSASTQSCSGTATSARR
jgi:hypothetical protein